MLHLHKRGVLGWGAHHMSGSIPGARGVHSIR